MIEPTPARHETVILWHGDDYQPLAEKMEAAGVAATKAAVSGPARIGDDPATASAVEDYEAFRTQALERATKVEMRALPRGGRNSDGSERVTWRSLLTNHPARKVTVKADDGTEREATHPDDQVFAAQALIGEWNTETMPDPLVRACLAPEQFANDSARDEWLDSLSDPEFSLLYSAAVRLNVTGGPDPKAQLSSLLDLTSTETSMSPERLG